MIGYLQLVLPAQPPPSLGAHGKPRLVDPGVGAYASWACGERADAMQLARSPTYLVEKGIGSLNVRRRPECTHQKNAPRSQPHTSTISLACILEFFLCNVLSDSQNRMFR